MPHLQHFPLKSPEGVLGKPLASGHRWLQHTAECWRSCSLSGAGTGETMCAAGAGTCRSRSRCQSLALRRPGRAVEAGTEEWTGNRERNCFFLQGPSFASTSKLNRVPAGKGELITRPNCIIAAQAMRGEFGSEWQRIRNWHTGKTLWAL